MRRKIRTGLLALAWVLFVLPAALHASPPVAADSTPVLRRGLNIAAWFTGGDTPDRQMHTHDMQQIKSAGFDFVRLPVAPDRFHFSLDGSTPVLQEIDFGKVDRAIALLTENGLAVVLDIHPPGEFMQELQGSSRAEARFADFWEALAMHYKNVPVQTLAFELLNEPQYYNEEEHWAAFARKLVARVRNADKDHLIIVSAARGSSVEGLLAIPPIRDLHIAYDFHFYEPYIITHLGADSFSSPIRDLRRLPYPSSMADKSKMALASVANEYAAMSAVDEYIAEDWSQKRMESSIRPAVEWGRQHHTRVLSLEFGVLRTYIDSESRYRWYADARKAFDASGIGWAAFDYIDYFGIVQRPGGMSQDPAPESRRIEPAALEALGLHPATAVTH